MTITEIQWMTELFKVKKMSKAAENLFITQPALSQCVQRIEQQLGFMLFERSNKGLIPTPKGELFCEAAKQITNIYQQFLYRADYLDQQKIREITIGMAPYMSYCCRVEMLKALRKQFSDIHFQVIEENTSGLFDALRENRAQLIIVHELACKDDVVSHPFGSFPVGIFLRVGSEKCKFAYEQNGKRYLDPRYLTDEPFILARKGQGTRLVMDQILKEAGIVPIVAAESRHITTRYHYALEGIASTIGPISGEALSLDTQQDESIIYRIPENYKHAFARLALCAQPGMDKLIPREMFSIIMNCINENKDFGVEK